MMIHTCIEKSVVIQATGNVSLLVSLSSVAPLSKALDFTILTFAGVIQPELKQNKSSKNDVMVFVLPSSS
jgi:hypothetical protein